MRTRILWAAVATLGFSLPIAVTLASPGQPDRIDTPIPPEDTNGARQSILIPHVTPAEDHRAYRMALYSPSPREVMTHPEIRILFYQSDHASPHPASGRIEVNGTPCTYESRAASYASDGRAIVFVRTGRCREGAPTGELILTLRMSGPGELGLYTIALPPEHRAGHLIYIAESAPHIPDPAPAVQGSFVDYMPDSGLRRAHLLSYVWTESTSPVFAWTALGGIALLVFAATWLVPMGEPPDGDRKRRFRVAAASAAAAFCCGTALALSYAILVPPMQAPDEPDHFASYLAHADMYAGHAEGPAVAAEAARWASVTHVARIRAHADQQFRPRDVGQPSPLATDFEVQWTTYRSSLTARFWVSLAQWLPAMPAHRLFLTVRVVYAVIFGAALAFASVLFVLLTTARYPQLLAFPFLFVPALPFFAMHFAESSLLTSVYVVFAAVIVILFLDGDRVHWVGLPLGLLTAAILTGAGSSLPMMALVATVLAARAVLGPHDDRRAAIKSSIFWLGFGIGASTFGQIVIQGHLDRIVNAMGFMTEQLPESLRTPMAWTTRPWFPMVVAVLGWGAEVLLTRVRAAGRDSVRPVLTFAARWGSVAAAIAVAGSLLGSLWWEYPTVESIQGPGRASLQQYLVDVGATMATMFRVSTPSLLFSTSFWAGFGWLDTIPDPAFVSLLVVLTGLSLIGVLLHVAWHREARRFMWLVIFACGSWVTLAVYAISAYQVKVNLHGRYVIGWYLAAIAVFWTLPALASPVGTGRLTSIARPAVFIALALGVHAFSLCFILRRYF